MSQHDAILAVDFGTSNSLAGAWVDGKRVEALPLDPFSDDPTLMRTLLYFEDADTCSYGQKAIDEYISNDMEGRLFRSFKSHLPNQNYLGTYIGNRVVTLETMIGTFLLELKKRSEKALKRKIYRGVFGRPARYSMDPVKDNFALHRMNKAIEFAGFQEYELVPEPLAAALDFRRNLNEEKILLIGDFGGGTSDFSVIRVGPYDYEKEHVLAIDGCPLAGDALDSLFMSQKLNIQFGAQSRYRLPMSENVLKMPPSVMEKLNQPAHIVFLKDKDTYEFIREVRKCTLTSQDQKYIDQLFVLIEDQQIFSFFEKIEKTKRELSHQAQSQFVFDYPDIEVTETFQQSEFVDWAQGTKDKIFASLDQCLANAQVSEEQIDLVCLTGGTSQVPLIKKEFELRFGAAKLQTQTQFHSVLSGLVESAGYLE